MDFSVLYDIFSVHVREVDAKKIEKTFENFERATLEKKGFKLY